MVAGGLGAPRAVADADELRRSPATATRPSCDVVADVLGGVRKAKSEAKVSMRAEVAAATVSGPPDALDRVGRAAEDLRAAGRIAELVFRTSDEQLAVSVTH